MKRNLLGGLVAREFLRGYWQKRPLVARNALKEYVARISPSDLFALATRDDVESRIVSRSRGRWSVRNGPFSRRELARLPRSGWTLLVQSVDHVLPAASRLLREFSFIPYARLDDVMVSYAVAGGGVGPHFDSYDVFLVQAAGTRRWRTEPPRDFDLVDRAPLKVLRGFRPQDEWILGPGDLLYVPPRWAHDGVALDECITCSVGFRAPDAQELASRFLDFLQDGLALDGAYADPDLAPTRKPGRIDTAMLDRLGSMLEGLRWSKQDVVRFLGAYLSEPRPNVTFARPRPPLTRAAFERAARGRGVELAPASRLLYHRGWIFMNGEAHAIANATLRTLADDRALPRGHRVDENAGGFLYEWYRAGYIRLHRG